MNIQSGFPLGNQPILKEIRRFGKRQTCSETNNNTKAATILKIDVFYLGSRESKFGACHLETAVLRAGGWATKAKG